MFGIADYSAFCAAILLFLALPGSGALASITCTGKRGLRVHCGQGRVDRRRLGACWVSAGLAAGGQLVSGGLGSAPGA
jgi:hypothetical protein